MIANLFSEATKVALGQLRRDAAVKELVGRAKRMTASIDQIIKASESAVRLLQDAGRYSESPPFLAACENMVSTLKALLPSEEHPPSKP